MRFLAGWYEVFLWGSIQDSSEQSVLTHRSSEPATHLLRILIAGRLPILFSQTPLQTLALCPTPNSIPASSSYPCPTPKHGTWIHFSPPTSFACHPDRSSGAFAAAEWRDPGNQATDPQFDPSNSTPVVFRLSPIYPLFQSIPFIFPLVEIPFSI